MSRPPLLRTFSLARLLPGVAHASAGIDLGPEPILVDRWKNAVLELTLGRDKTRVLQVWGPDVADAPHGTRDGAPFTFTRDEFGAWLAEALPGAYSITLGSETFRIDFTDP